MANLWITGDSWGVLCADNPNSHWVNHYAKHYKLKNIYCLARAGISQDMINYITHSVVRNIDFPGRGARWNNLDDHLIVFPTTPTRVTFNMIWDNDRFDEQLGPHNLNWKSGAPAEAQPWPWYTDNSGANLESENFTSLHTCDNPNKDVVERYGLVHPCKFTEWRDNNHLHHIVKEVNNFKIYGSRKLPNANTILGEKGMKKSIGKEQINHLCSHRHKNYWKGLVELL